MAPARKKAKARLLEVQVLPVFVLDEGDGSDLEPGPQIDPIRVKPKDWPTFATDQFPKIAAEYERQVNAPVPANRAERRAAAKSTAKSTAKSNGRKSASRKANTGKRPRGG